MRYHTVAYGRLCATPRRINLLRFSRFEVGRGRTRTMPRIPSDCGPVLSCGRAPRPPSASEREKTASTPSERGYHQVPPLRAGCLEHAATNGIVLRNENPVSHLLGPRALCDLVLQNRLEISLSGQSPPVTIDSLGCRIRLHRTARCEDYRHLRGPL